MHIDLDAVTAVVKIPHEGIELIEREIPDCRAVICNEVFAEKLVQADIVMPV